MKTDDVPWIHPALAESAIRADGAGGLALIPIERLSFDPANARRHPEKNHEATRASLRRFGQRTPIVVQKQGMIVRAGNDRLRVFQEEGWSHVAALVVDENSVDATAYAIADNRTGELAEWDDDTLAKQLRALIDDGVDPIGFDDDDLGELIETLGDAAGEDCDENPYTDKVSVPPYEITGPKPELSDVYDSEKCRALLDDIEVSDLPEHEKEFLRAAAYRHVVFNFQRAAEYYAHSEAEVQRLFEDSALVIVDIEKAIKNGWARLSAALDAIYEDEEGVGDE